jgi:hypothetical protein
MECKSEPEPSQPARAVGPLKQSGTFSGALQALGASRENDVRNREKRSISFQALHGWSAQRAFCHVTPFNVLQRFSRFFPEIVAFDCKW